jgi:triacylglycerol esterase/lipase EstA (alpha/beta hydrolase family)
MKTSVFLAVVGLLWASQLAAAAQHEIRVPLQNGKLELSDLSAVACQGVHLPAWHFGEGEINLQSWRGTVFLAALNASCGDACHVTVLPDSLDFRFDAQKLPVLVDNAKRFTRTYVATKYPQATAAQARHYGLFVPPRLDPARPLVVLIHGLDCNIGMLEPMGIMLEARGLQVAYFCYPSDQGIAPDIELLDQKLRDLHDAYPAVRIDLIGHSMGGLIARGYVEGDTYRNDVDHLIMVGTPNGGSNWTNWHLLLKAQKEFYQARRDPDWNWTWAITDGMGEGARDLKPNSEFLRQLNSRPRRTGVRYTLIAGSHSALATFESEIAMDLARVSPEKSSQWWGIRQAETGLSHAAEQLAATTNRTDGPVSVASTSLQGVKDVVVLPADHVHLFVGNEQKPPVALWVILDRLGVANFR